MSPLDRYFSFQFFEVVVFRADVVFHEVFDVIEILVYLAEVVEPRVGPARSSEVAQKIPCSCKFLG